MQPPAERWIEKAWEALEDDRDKEAAEHAICALTLDPSDTDGLLVLAMTPQVPPVRSALLREAVRIARATLEEDADAPVGSGLLELMAGHRYLWSLRALAAFLNDSEDPDERSESENLSRQADVLDGADVTGAKANFTPQACG